MTIRLMTTTHLYKFDQSNDLTSQRYCLQYHKRRHTGFYLPKGQCKLQLTPWTHVGWMSDTTSLF